MKITTDKDGKLVVSDFSATQAVKIAIRMESDGIQFYQDLLSKVRDEDARNEVDFLIKEETQHLKTFEALLAREKEHVEDGFEEDDIVNYLDSHIFDASREKERAKAMDHRHTALEEAMNMEKRSIFFYQGCLEGASDPEAKKAFEAIIEEEKRHLSKFTDLLRVKCINSGKGCVL